VSEFLKQIAIQQWVAIFLCRLANLDRDLVFYSENEGGGLELGL